MRIKNKIAAIIAIIFFIVPVIAMGQKQSKSSSASSSVSRLFVIPSAYGFFPKVLIGAPTNNWKGIYINFNVTPHTCDIRNTDIRIDKIKEQDSTVIESTTKPRSSFLFYNLPIAPGPIYCTYDVVGAEKVSNVPVEIESYDIYKFKDQLITVLPESENGVMEIILKVNSQKQTLVKFKHGEYVNDIQTSFVGDIDRDGKVDILLHYGLGGESGADYVFLSSLAKNGMLVEKFASCSY
ncbi:MAG: hypothetical protein ABUS47_08755 [Steroidobacter sp.]